MHLSKAIPKRGDVETNFLHEIIQRIPVHISALFVEIKILVPVWREVLIGQGRRQLTRRAAQTVAAVERRSKPARTLFWCDFPFRCCWWGWRWRTCRDMCNSAPPSAAGVRPSVSKYPPLNEVPVAISSSASETKEEEWSPVTETSRLSGRIKLLLAHLNVGA